MKSSEESPGGNIEIYNSGPWIPKHMVRYPMTLRTQSLFKIAMKILIREEAFSKILLILIYNWMDHMS